MKDKILKVYQDVVEVLQEMDYESIVYEDYSGRSMYSRNVPGYYLMSQQL